MMVRDGPQRLSCLRRSYLVIVEIHWGRGGLGLSPGTKNAPDFDQAARNVACMAEVLRLAGRAPDAMTNLAFLVTAPQAQIEAGIFGDLVSQPSIRGKVIERVTSYSGERDKWLHEWFEPVLESLLVELLSWESLLVGAPEALTEFYARCTSHRTARSTRLA